MLKPLPAKVTIEWQAPEYHHFPKTANWYWAVGVTGGVLALVALALQNFLFVVLVMLASFALVLYGGRPPETHTYALTRRGLRIGERLFPYNSLHSFWVDDQSERPKIIIQSRKLLLPHLIFPLAPGMDGEELRDFLLAHLPEEHHEDSIADVVGDMLGF